MATVSEKHLLFSRNKIINIIIVNKSPNKWQIFEDVPNCSKRHSYPSTTTLENELNESRVYSVQCSVNRHRKHQEPPETVMEARDFSFDEYDDEPPPAYDAGHRATYNRQSSRGSTKSEKKSKWKDCSGSGHDRGRLHEEHSFCDRKGVDNHCVCSRLKRTGKAISHAVVGALLLLFG